MITDAGKIVEMQLSNTDIIFSKNVVTKAFSIINQPNHPLNSEFVLLPSGRRFKEVKCRTMLYKNTFIPSAIKSANSAKEKNKKIFLNTYNVNHLHALCVPC